jgi:hypothetical protein
MEDELFVEATPIYYNWRIWALVGLTVVALVAVAVWMNHKRWATSPWWSDRYQASQHWFDLIPWFRPSKPHLDADLSHASELPTSVPQMPEPSVEESAHGRETWCLVGEDLSGRYCVRVPGPDSCTHDRSYGSRDDCVMTPANHMPAGIALNQSTRLLPLRDLKFKA